MIKELDKDMKQDFWKKNFINLIFNRLLSWLNSNFIPIKKYDVMIYKELFISYLASFFIISLIVWLKEIYLIYVQYIQKGAQFWTTLKIFFYSLPFTMAITIPAGMVMAALLTFNKLSVNLEILIMRASGIKKIRLFLPVLIFSSFVSVLTYWFFDTLLVKGNEMYLRSMIQMRVEKPFIDIAPGEFPKIGQFNIGFDDINGDEIKGIEIYQKISDGERIVKANKGKIISTGDTPYYQVLLKDGTFIEKTRGGEIFSSQFKEAELRIDYEVSFIPTFNVETQPRLMSRYKTAKMIENMEKQAYIKKNLSTISSLDKKILSTYIDLAKLLPSYLISFVVKGNENVRKDFDNLKNYLSNLYEEMRRISTSPEMVNYNIFVFEQHKKTSIPVSAIVYGLIGFVFGIMIKVRTGRGGSLIIGIIVILLQTYFTYVAEIPVRNGVLNPVVAAWYSNVILSIPALYLLFREKA